MAYRFFYIDDNNFGNNSYVFTYEKYRFFYLFKGKNAYPA